MNESGGDGHKTIKRGDRAAQFKDLWSTDVAPVHERTEASRQFRTQYAHLAIRTMIGLNAGGMIAVPLVGWLLGVPYAPAKDAMISSLSLFLVGLVLILVAVLLCYIMLDIDVIRQKAERIAARYQIVRIEFSDSFTKDMEEAFDKSVRTQHVFWRLGEGLAWTSVVLGVLSLSFFIAASIYALDYLNSVG